jgi:aminopeptidase-like protein
MTGEAMHALLERLFPIQRGLTGDGNRLTLRILAEHLPGLEVREIPSGTTVGDWTIPAEWNVDEAWIRDEDGRTLVDLAAHGLHLASGSKPFRGWLSFEELRSHLHTHPDDRTAIPYRTNYYRDDWDFCLSAESLERDFRPGCRYEVLVGARRDPAGSLTLAELVLPGRDPRPVVVSTYICHPWMANDNLSGVVVATALARRLAGIDRSRTWRFVFAPETLGTLAWAAPIRQELSESCLGGIVLSTCAGPGRAGWKGTMEGADHWLDRAMGEVVRERFPEAVRWSFDPHGSDERQLSSPGLRIPCVSFHQARYYDWPGYHSSLDTASSVTPRALSDALAVHVALADRIEQERFPERVSVPGEAMLGPKGLYPALGGAMLPGQELSELDMILWLQFSADGRTPVCEMARRHGGDPATWDAIASRMVEKGVLHG